MEDEYEVKQAEEIPPPARHKRIALLDRVAKMTPGQSITVDDDKALSVYQFLVRNGYGCIRRKAPNTGKTTCYMVRDSERENQCLKRDERFTEPLPKRSPEPAT